MYDGNMGKGKDYFNRRGFTLMEMLVAVTLFGIIIWILVPEFLHAQARSRDARRKADLFKISEALEEYRSDYGFYPTPYPTFAIGPMVGPNAEYLKNVPVDPKYKTDYCYIPSSNNLSYVLSALFELEQSECPWAPTAIPTPTAGPIPPPAPTATPTPTAVPTATPTPTAAPTATPTPIIKYYGCFNGFCNILPLESTCLPRYSSVSCMDGGQFQCIDPSTGLPRNNCQ